MSKMAFNNINYNIPVHPCEQRAAIVRPSGDGSLFDVYPADDCGPTFTVKTLHISCKSDTYRESEHKYGGIVIYARNGQTDWYTANNTHCKSGYVVIMQTDTKEFQEKQRWCESGQVHGTIYKIAFGESCDDVKVVGEGFGIIDGKFKTTSGAFNPAYGDYYHDNTVYMHPDSARYVEALVGIWKQAGPTFPARQNYSVKDLELKEELYE